MFVVIRYFNAGRAGMPFERTAWPGLTVFGGVRIGGEVVVDLSTGKEEGEWVARVDTSVEFPVGLEDDVFLHVSTALIHEVAGRLRALLVLRR